MLLVLLQSDFVCFCQNRIWSTQTPPTKDRYHRQGDRMCYSCSRWRFSCMVALFNHKVSWIVKIAGAHWWRCENQACQRKHVKFTSPLIPLLLVWWSPLWCDIGTSCVNLWGRSSIACVHIDISFSLPLALESIIQFTSPCDLTLIVHNFMWLTPIVHISMCPTLKGFTRVNNLVHIAMWLTPKSNKVRSCFACERSFSLRVCHIHIRMYFANFLCLQCYVWSYSS